MPRVENIGARTVGTLDSLFCYGILFHDFAAAGSDRTILMRSLFIILNAVIAFTLIEQFLRARPERFQPDRQRCRDWKMSTTYVVMTVIQRQGHTRITDTWALSNGSSISSVAPESVISMSSSVAGQILQPATTPHLLWSITAIFRCAGFTRVRLRCDSSGLTQATPDI